MNSFNVIAGVASIVAFFFALWEYKESRQKEAVNSERFSQQQQKNQSALRASMIGAQHADRIVQRSKDENVTVEELASLARLTRGVMLYLAQELKAQDEVLEAWRFGKAMTESIPPSHEEGEETSA